MPEVLVRHRQLLTYLAGGALSAVIDVGLMQLLLINRSPLLLATSAGFAAGLAFNYAFHSRLTFQSPITGGTFARYLCVVALNYLITLACVGAAAFLFASPMAGKLLALFIVPVNGFLLGKYWIFTPPTMEKQGQ